MFASNSAIFLFLFALASSVLATPPACLLAAVNEQQNPADLSSVCGDKSSDVQQAIASLCGSNVVVAESAFAATCSSAGHKVASYTVSSTPTNSAGGSFVYTTESYDSACSCTKTYVTSTTRAAIPSTAPGGQATGSASSTATGSAGANASGAAVPGAQQAVGSLAAAVVAVAGLVAWL